VVLIVLSLILWDYKSTVAVIVPYITVNIYNYSRPVVEVTNNLTGLIFSRVGRKDLGMSFGNKPGP